MKFKSVYLLIGVFPFLVQCASLGTSGNQTHEFFVKGSPTIDSVYFSNSKTNKMVAGKLVDSQNETLVFKIRTETTKVDDQKKLIFQKQTTISREGEGKLNDMGFPELNQSIQFVYTPKGEVVKAGDFPKGSIFYLPQVPLPDEPVRIGDTWQRKYLWMGLTNHIPLEADLLVIFKGVETCDTDKKCALLEISGEVQILGFATERSDFKSEIRGKVMYSLTNGEVLSSHIQSTELLLSGPQAVRVASCVIGEKQLSKETLKDSPICDPTQFP